MIIRISYTLIFSLNTLNPSPSSSSPVQFIVTNLRNPIHSRQASIHPSIPIPITTNQISTVSEMKKSIISHHHMQCISSMQKPPAPGYV
ncbi:hypothetical protein ASPBRDRAFT_570876 [Aspergillus brasiliensis CBS 101740]|uniref:Uncharacterized protein n=1 Tax=Aspergillus brasiliensis (strain CBS 101740 / IMI 381727 / IBT 21946) TaxID=767769 RepID=A0A1L9UIV8_ASPBC|nr:hypothetical protein ASPBRDRAFT_570876 [Aspergillus brasiliensis CBS 101740]